LAAWVAARVTTFWTVAVTSLGVPAGMAVMLAVDGWLSTTANRVEGNSGDDEQIGEGHLHDGGDVREELRGRLDPSVEKLGDC
jgi:hypothetical protein